jgi:hypothetical protein
MTLRYAHLAPDYIADALRAALPEFEAGDRRVGRMAVQRSHS